MRRLVAVVAVLASLAITATPAAAHSKAAQLTAWCTLSVGQSRTTVVHVMGKPHGHKAASTVHGLAQVHGYSAAEWDVGHDILLATFNGGSAVNLQAYAGYIGPVGATDIGCPAFRH